MSYEHSPVDSTAKQVFICPVSHFGLSHPNVNNTMLINPEDGYSIGSKTSGMFK